MTAKDDLCDNIDGYLTDPNINGPNAYGNANVIANKCAGYSDPKAFNEYCLIPTLSTAFTNSCLAVGVSAPVVDNSDMIFNQMMQEHIDDWDVPIINSPPILSARYNNSTGQNVLVGGDYFLSFSSTGFDCSFTTSDLPNKMTNVPPPTVLPTGIFRTAYAMDGNGTIYYASSNFGGPQQVTLRGYFPKTGVTANAFTFTSPGISHIAVSPDGIHKYFIDSDGKIFKWDGGATPTEITRPVGYIAVGSTDFFKVSNTEIVITVMQETAGARFIYRYVNTIWTQIHAIGVKGSPRPLGVDGILYFASPEPDNTLKEIFEVQLIPSTPIVTQVTNVAFTNIQSTSFALSDDANTLWLFKANGDILTSEDFGQTSIVQTNTGGFYVYSRATVGDNALYYVIRETNTSSDFDVYLYDKRQQFQLFREITTANSTTPLMFLDNSSLALVNGEGVTIINSNNGDGNLSLKQVSVATTNNNIIISDNGLYKLEIPDEDTFKISFNPVNSSDFVLACNATLSRKPFCNNANSEYCNSVKHTDGQFGDPRCFCYQNNENIIANMFNVELLKQNPSLYAQLVAIAPCMSSVCRPKYFDEDTWVGNTLRNLECPGTINICTNILTLGDSAEIDGDVVVNTNCGASSAKTPCSSTCPIGQTCNENYTVLYQSMCKGRRM